MSPGQGLEHGRLSVEAAADHQRDPLAHAEPGHWSLGARQGDLQRGRGHERNRLGQRRFADPALAREHGPVFDEGHETVVTKLRAEAPLAHHRANVGLERRVAGGGRELAQGREHVVE